MIKLCFIGSSSLLRQCVQQALNRGLTVGGVVPTDRETHQWASEHHLPILSLRKLKRHPKHSFDYLFSIVNSTILDKSILALPKWGTINFHDGPLPRYAGVHATSWAILKGETTHAITWHLVDEGIDTGSILVQSSVAILPDDTAYTFNLRCFNIALTAFNTLLKKIKQGLTPSPQDLSKRTYFPYAKKPIDNGIIHWQSSVDTIDRLVRATYYGHHANDLSCAKCLLNGQWLIVATLCIRNDPSNIPPGHVIEMDDHHLCVSTGSNGGVCIHELFTLTGKKIDLTELVRRLKHDQVTKFSELSVTARKNFQTFSERIFKHESYWVNELKKIEPSTFPFHHFTLKRKPTYNKAKSIQWQISSQKLTALKQKFPKIPVPSILLAGFLLYMYRINQNDSVSIGIHQPVRNALLTTVTQQLVYAVRPFTMDQAENISTTEWITRIHHHYQKITTQQPFLTDVFYRYSLDNLFDKCVIVHCTDRLSKEAIESTAQIHIQITTRGKWHWFLPNQNPLRSLINRVFKHLDHLFDGFLSASTSIHHVSIVPADEYDAIMSLNQTAVAFPFDKTIYDVFRAQVKKHPHKKAIIEGGHTITYQTLLDTVHRLANALQREGVQKNTFVGIWMNRSIESITSMLAITAIGAAYLPLRVKDPIARITLMLTNASIKYILTRKSAIKKESTTTLPKHIHLLCVETLLHQSNSKRFQYIPFPSTHAAYVNYTSGTTGKPKGIVISHRNIMRLVKNQNYFNFSNKHIFAHLADLAFDATTFEVWGALLNGSTVCVFSPKTILNVKAFKKQFCICTALFMTPTLLKQILSEDISFFDHIHTLIVGGEACDGQTLRILLDRKKEKQLPLQLVNGYGPTESTTFAICHQINKLSPKATAAPIGRPIHNTTAYVFDKYQQVLPLGIKGELYLGGDGLAKGYLNNNEETRRCFIQTSLGRLYKTGDLAIIDFKTLNFLFQGRRDFQIKLRGFRIELDDVRAHLLKQKAIKESVVHLLPINKQKQLIAYIVLNRTSATVNDQKIRNELAQTLPTYMIPTRFIVLKKLPMQRTGKLDYRALENIATAHIQSLSIQTKQANVLLRLVEEYLHVKNITGNESYQNLGGDSITTMQIVSKAREQGLIIDPMLLFESNSLNQVIQTSSTRTAHRFKKQIISISKLGPIQYWFFHKKLLQPNRFTQVVQLTLRQCFSMALLETFLNKLIEAHPILCTRFENQSMILGKSPGVDIHTIHVNQGRIKQSLAALLHQLESQMNMTQGKLFQAGLLYTKPKQTLVLMVHHLVIDGVSWRVLLEDLSRLMQQHIKKETLTLLPEQTSFLGWVDHLHEQAKQFYTTKEIHYWADQCAAVQRSSVQIENLEKDTDTLTRVFSTVESWCQNGVSINENYFSPFVVLLAQNIHALSRWKQRPDVFLTLECHGRYPLKKHIDLSRTVGWFTSLYPFYIIIKENITDIALLNTIQRQLSNIPRHGMGYSILKELHSCESIKTLPIPPISFNYLGNFDHAMTPSIRQFFEWSHQGIQLYSGSLNTRQHQIDITCYIYQAKLHFSIKYNRTLFSQKKIQRFFDLLHENFNALDQWLTTKVSYLPLSTMQQGLLFHSIENSDSPIYWVRVKWEIEEALNVDCYKKAWEMLLSQYPQLKVAVHWDNKSNIVQRMSKKVTLPFRYIDKIDPKTKTKSAWGRESPMTHPLNRAPLFTVTLVKLNANHYITVFDHHHALLDGWSLGLLLKTLTQNYQNLIQQRQLTIIPFQNPRAYVEWLRHINKNEAKKFWLRYLEDTFPLLSLGIERKQPRIRKNIIIRRERYCLSSQELKKIDKIAKQYGVTQNVIFQTAWAILLSLYSNQQSIVFGMTFSLRNLAGLKLVDQVGLYINTLPFRITLNACNHISDIWKSIKKNIDTILRLGYISLLDLNHWLQNSTTSNGLFKFLYIFENFPFKLNSFFKKLSIHDPTHYPLALSVEARGEYKIILSYHVNSYTKETVKNLLKRYISILKNTIVNHEKTFADIEFTTKSQKEILLSKVRQSKSDYSALTVYKLFEKQVARTPKKIAIKYDDRFLSYKQLHDNSIKAANYLIKYNVKKGDHVGVYFEDTELAIIAILGLLRLGAVYVPIDITCPPERIKYIVKIAQLKNILTDFSQQKFFKKVLNRFQKSLLFNQCYLKETALAKVEENTSSNDLMYVMFTSGSTGLPKGVKITHANVSNILSYFHKKIPILKRDIVLNNTVLSFDISVLEIFGALTAGATLLLVKPAILSDPYLYKQFLEKENPTILQMTPSGWRRLVQTGWSPLETMKILSGGEALPTDLATVLLKNVPYFWNVYGPTETTIWSTIKKITSPSKITIGKAISNTSLFILSHWDTILPPGIAGELCIGGDGVAPEYINNAGETYNRFITLKVDSTHSIRVYKTGDRVIELDNGELFFLGRIDNQIKQYGYRIELGEIESQLLKYVDTKHAAVCFDAEDGTTIIKAYIEPKNIKKFSINLLKDYLHEFLPNYMIPSQYVVVEKIPTLTSGKINRQTLKGLKTIYKKASKKIKEADYSLMLHLWSEVFKKTDITLDDDFFQTGGNSLIALRLLINIEKAFNRRVNFQALLQYPTARELMNQLYHCKEGVNLTQKTFISNPIVRLNRIKSNKNLFLIHPIGGHVFWFASLSRYIQRDWNVYAIQDPGVVTGNVYFLSLEEMCQFYQTAIRGIQAKGPYYLGGASFGATAAFEIAKQLTKNNEKVNFVGLFDGWAEYPKEINTKKFMQDNMWRQYHEMETKALGGQSFLMQPIVDIHWQRSNMLSKYKLEYIPVPLTLFKSLETMSIFKPIDCDDNGWQPYTNKLNIIRVPGTHESMFYGDNVCTLGKKILEYLQKACYSDTLET